MVYQHTLRVGTILIGEYRIVSVLGGGGFSNTYLAVEQTLQREVALKEFFPGDVAYRDGGETVRIRDARHESQFKWGMERFVREAQTLANFRHPNIVRVYRIFDANDTAYIVLDYVKGVDMDVWLSGLGRRPTQTELDSLAALLVEALELVHGKNILHRDIKPQNIYIRAEDGLPVLLDFGAARYSVGELTGTTTAIVSRGYSPHEAYATESRLQGPWTDIYGLAATFYRAISGEPPPESTQRAIEDTITSATKLSNAGEYRRDFLEAIDWGLSILPKSRPQSVSDWKSRLIAGSSRAAAVTSPPFTLDFAGSAKVPPATPSGPVVAPLTSSAEGPAEARSGSRSSDSLAKSTTAPPIAGPAETGETRPPRDGQRRSGRLVPAVASVLVLSGAGVLGGIQTGLFKDPFNSIAGLPGSSATSDTLTSVASAVGSAAIPADAGKASPGSASGPKANSTAPAEPLPQPEVAVHHVTPEQWPVTPPSPEASGQSNSSEPNADAGAGSGTSEDAQQTPSASGAAQPPSSASPQRVAPEKPSEPDAVAKAQEQTETQPEASAPSPLPSAVGPAPAADPSPATPSPDKSAADVPLNPPAQAAVPTNPDQPDGKKGDTEVALLTPEPEQAPPETPLTTERRSALVRDVQTELRERNCYSGDINGELGPAESGIAGLSEAMKAASLSPKPIQLASAGVKDFEDWLSWIKALGDFRCAPETTPETGQKQKKLWYEPWTKKKQEDESRPNKERRQEKARPAPRRDKPEPQRPKTPQQPKIPKPAPVYKPQSAPSPSRPVDPWKPNR